MDGVTSAIEKAETKSDFCEVVCNIAPTMYCNYIIFYSVEAHCNTRSKIKLANASGHFEILFVLG